MTAPALRCSDSLSPSSPGWMSSIGRVPRPGKGRASVPRLAAETVLAAALFVAAMAMSESTLVALAQEPAPPAQEPAPPAEEPAGEVCGDPQIPIEDRPTRCLKPCGELKRPPGDGQVLCRGKDGQPVHLPPVDLGDQQKLADCRAEMPASQKPGRCFEGRGPAAPRGDRPAPIAGAETSAKRVQRTELPRTGADSARLALAGGVLILAGFALLAQCRDKPSRSSL
jgi:LPXTG-motif cell wall-anchored protein